MPDKSFEPQDAVLKSESQAKKLKFSKTDVVKYKSYSELQI